MVLLLVSALASSCSEKYDYPTQPNGSGILDMGGRWSGTMSTMGAGYMQLSTNGFTLQGTYSFGGMGGSVSGSVGERSTDAGNEITRVSVGMRPSSVVVLSSCHWEVVGMVLDDIWTGSIHAEYCTANELTGLSSSGFFKLEKQ